MYLQRMLMILKCNLEMKWNNTWIVGTFHHVMPIGESLFFQSKEELQKLKDYTFISSKNNLFYLVILRIWIHCFISQLLKSQCLHLGCKLTNYIVKVEIGPTHSLSQNLSIYLPKDAGNWGNKVTLLGDCIRYLPPPWSLLFKGDALCCQKTM